MDFKEYYHKKLDEELEMQRSEAEKSFEANNVGAYDQSGLDAVVARYLRNGDIKEGLKKLAQDLGAAIYNYSISDGYIPDDIFDSADSKQKYMNAMTQKIQQGYNSTLVELMRHAAIDIANARNSIAM